MQGFKWLRKALMKRLWLETDTKVSKKVRMKEVPPSEKVVYGVTFAIAALLCLTALEIVYMVVVKQFSSEIFSGIMLVIGIILGTFFGVKG